MIISAYSQSKRKFGAIDEDTHKVVVPYNFSICTVQPDGIVVRSENLRYGCYSLGGKELYSPNSSARIDNILFFKNNCFAFFYPKQNVVAISDFEGRFILPPDFQAFKFFLGLDFKAIEFSVKSNSYQIISLPFFCEFGASIPTKLCVKLNDLWGVYNTLTKSMEYECIYPNAEQFLDSYIILYDIAKNETKVY